MVVLIVVLLGGGHREVAPLVEMAAVIAFTVIVTDPTSVVAVQPFESVTENRSYVVFTNGETGMSVPDT